MPTTWNCWAAVALLLLVTMTKSATSHALPSATKTSDDYETLSRAKALLAKIDGDHSDWNNKVTIAAWQYASNLTEENLANQLQVSSDFADYISEMYKEVSQFPWQSIDDYDIRRKFKKLSSPGAAALSKDKYLEYEQLISSMENTYATAKVCDLNEETKNCSLNLEPELTEIMMTSRDPERLKHLWKAWRDESGKRVKDNFIKYVELSNEIARLNNFSDMSAYWIKEYEDDDFYEVVESLWQEIKPLYHQLHTYVRRQLYTKYGDKVVKKDGPIPAHLLGNMWAQTWGNIADFTTPYPGKKLPDVTEEMVKQGYDEIKIFRTAEDFFTSLDLAPMPETFWNNSILKKPDNVELICHASAWDFYDSTDFRIKQCTRINMEDLLTAHHEMGHVQYFLQYKNQPVMYKEGANPGFHEAVGDTIALSASTPEHLKEIGLLSDDKTDQEAFINHLYFKGLDKIAFLPFAYTMDKWRWNVFQGKTKPESYNDDWWKLSLEYQGIEPPVERSADDFDPGAKYHIVASVEYIRYFISFIVQFQFHKALCIEAGQYDPANPAGKPLSQCNIYGNKKAGKLFSEMLQLGSSVPWQDAMEKITGQRKMDASGLLEYFKPLTDMLEAENSKNNEYIGWKTSE